MPLSEEGLPSSPSTRYKDAMTALSNPAPTVDSLALEFCDAMRATLSAEQMKSVVSLNREETNPHVCHSHDFCDANMVLHEVFMRRGMDLSDEARTDRLTDLWNQTWDLAKSRDFRMFKRGDRVEMLDEFKDPGDKEFTWVVRDDEEKGRVDIVPVDIPMDIKPIYAVQVAWIRLAEEPVRLP